AQRGDIVGGREVAEDERAVGNASTQILRRKERRKGELGRDPLERHQVEQHLLSRRLIGQLAVEALQLLGLVVVGRHQRQGGQVGFDLRSLFGKGGILRIFGEQVFALLLGL